VSAAQDEAFRIAQRLVQIAVSPDLGELREAMITETVMGEFFGDSSTPSPIRLAIAAGVIQNLSAAIETFAGELAGSA
jgi:hypothetical protein